MDPRLLVLLILLGVVAAAAGLWLIRSSKGDKGRFERPAQVERTDAHGRSRIVDRWVYLALELCRCDGAISEAEIAAIEKALIEGVVAIPADEAARMVHKALRSTIRQAQVGAAIEEIARHADGEHRSWVVDGLEAIARADGAVNRDERLFLSRVKTELGC